MNQPLLQIVVGGQYGSEAKGHVAAQLAARLKEPLVIRTGGPNAGHTVVGPDGRVHKLRQLPTAVVSNPGAQLGISAGSLIDPAVLEQEMIEQGLDYAYCERLVVDPAATIIEQAHKDAEQGNESLVNWSTQKGIGAARADRIWRQAQTVKDYYGNRTDPWLIQASVSSIARGKLATGQPVLIEAAQGYGLGLHTRYYPKTTSADCTAIDALADVGLPSWAVVPRVWVVLRPFPIRVAGDSGPLMAETSWEDLGLEPEFTTVTNKVRRVGLWNPNLAAEAIWANGGPAPNVVAALTMADQVVPAVRGMATVEDLRTLSDTDTRLLQKWVHKIQALGAQVKAIGTGPATMVFLDELDSETRVPADAAIHRSGE